MIADNVKCINCGEEMFVVRGTEICPKCKKDGVLSWVDNDNQEIDVPEYKVINLDD